MYPHERSLVKRLADEPFALIGVNSDPKAKVVGALERENITWRSFWDGGNTSGPIASKWNVRSWPTIYVLDHKKEIISKRIGAEQLEELMDKIIENKPQQAIEGGDR